MNLDGGENQLDSEDIPLPYMVFSLTFCTALLLGHRLFMYQILHFKHSHILWSFYLCSNFLNWESYSYLSSGLYNLWIECLWVTHAIRNLIVNVNKVGGYHIEADNKTLMYK